MEKKLEFGREIRELETGLSNIRNSGNHFVAYNVKYLGHSFSDDYIINGKSTKNSKSLKEFCYGYDGQHGQLHFIRVYQMENGKKYASKEITMCVYAFWEIIE